MFCFRGNDITIMSREGRMSSGYGDIQRGHSVNSVSSVPYGKYTCPIYVCQLEFHRIDNLKRHIQLVHGRYVKTGRTQYLTMEDLEPEYARYGDFEEGGEFANHADMGKWVDRNPILYRKRDTDVDEKVSRNRYEPKKKRDNKRKHNNVSSGSTERRDVSWSERCVSQSSDDGKRKVSVRMMSRSPTDDSKRQVDEKLSKLTRELKDLDSETLSSLREKFFPEAMEERNASTMIQPLMSNSSSTNVGMDSMDVVKTEGMLVPSGYSLNSLYEDLGTESLIDIYPGDYVDINFEKIVDSDREILGVVVEMKTDVPSDNDRPIMADNITGSSTVMKSCPIVGGVKGDDERTGAEKIPESVESNKEEKAYKQSSTGENLENYNMKTKDIFMGTSEQIENPSIITEERRNVVNSPRELGSKKNLEDIVNVLKDTLSKTDVVKEVNEKEELITVQSDINVTKDMLARVVKETDVVQCVKVVKKHDSKALINYHVDTATVRMLRLLKIGSKFQSLTSVMCLACEMYPETSPVQMYKRALVIMVSIKLVMYKLSDDRSQRKSTGRCVTVNYSKVQEMSDLNTTMSKKELEKREAEYQEVYGSKTVICVQEEGIISGCLEKLFHHKFPPNVIEVEDAFRVMKLNSRDISVYAKNVMLGMRFVAKELVSSGIDVQVGQGVNMCIGDGVVSFDDVMLQRIKDMTISFC